MARSEPIAAESASISGRVRKSSRSRPPGAPRGRRAAVGADRAFSSAEGVKAKKSARAFFLALALEGAPISAADLRSVCGPFTVSREGAVFESVEGDADRAKARQNGAHVSANSLRGRAPSRTTTRPFFARLSEQPRIHGLVPDDGSRRPVERGQRVLDGTYSAGRSKATNCVQLTRIW